MRILIAGVNYAPEVTGIAPFTTGLAEHLAQSGHDVTVATTFPFAPYWKWFQPPLAWRAREQMNGVDVCRTKVVLPKKRTTFSRIVFDTSVGFASAIGALSIPSVDVAICVSPPIQTALGLAAVRFKVARLVILVQDLPTKAAQSVGMLRQGFALRVGKSLEHFSYQHANHIVVISESFAAYIKGVGVDSERISEIPNWADVESIRPSPPSQETRRRLGAGPDDFLVVHTGNMGGKQDLLNVVRTAALLRNDRNIRIALVGDGQDRELIAGAISSGRLDNIQLVALQDQDEFSRILTSADALLINQAAGVVNSVLPSKLLAYMASGRPVLAAAHRNNTTTDLVRRAGCGVLTEPAQPEALAEEVRRMAARVDRVDFLSAMGLRGRAYAMDHFDRNTILERWDKLVMALGSEDPH